LLGARKAPYTGTYEFEHKGLAAGTAQTVTDQSVGYWSIASRPSSYNNGTYRYLFGLGQYTDGGAKVIYIGWSKGAAADKQKITFFRTGAAGTGAVATGATEFTTGGYALLKVRFSSGVWEVWKEYGAGWDAIGAPELTLDDSGTYTELDFLRMDINSTTDEGKAANQSYFCDDLCAWDANGGNWNSLLSQNDFPRISAAHVSDIAGAKDEGPPAAAGQGVKIDEIPPDAVAQATVDETDYWTDVEDFKPGAVQIQAVMVTHVAGTFAAEDAELSKFNYTPDQGTTLYTDCEFDGRRVQFGTDGADPTWFHVAGYFPWTPEAVPRLWTEAIFESSQFGISLIDTKTDQLTVQVIYFGSSAEWPLPTHQDSLFVWQAINRSNTY
jgi:hypothetical protein